MEDGQEVDFKGNMSFLALIQEALKGSQIRSRNSGASYGHIGPTCFDDMQRKRQVARGHGLELC